MKEIWFALLIAAAGAVWSRDAAAEKEPDKEVPEAAENEKETPAAVQSRAHEMPEIVVTGTALAKEPIEQPYAFYRYGREVLDISVGRTALDRINYGPGIFIQHTAPSQTSPFIRGLTGEQSLLLLDGIRLSHALMRPGLNQYAAMVPDVSISRADVILGSSSVINGSDGLTGAIDLRLPRAGRGVGEAASAWVKTRVDSANGAILQLGLDGEPQESPWAYSFEADLREFHDRIGGKDFAERVFAADTDNYEEIPNTAYNQQAVAGRTAYTGLADHRFEVNFGLAEQSDTPRPDGYAENTGSSSRLFRLYEKQKFTYVHLRDIWNADLDWLQDLRTTVSWHRHREEMRRASIRDAGTPTEYYRERFYDDTIDSVGFNLLARTIAGRGHEISWGFTGIVEETGNSYTEYRTPAGITDPSQAAPYEPENWSNRTSVSDGSEYTSMGIFGQDSYDITDTVNLLYGARYSQYGWSFGDVDGSASDITGSIRSLWKFRRDMNVFAGLSKGFRAPNLKNLDGAVDRGSSGNPAEGNPELDPEVSYTAETGWRYLEGADSFAVTLFYTLVDDLIQRDFGMDPEFTNVEEAAITGFETAWDYGLPSYGFMPAGSRLSFRGSASLVNAKKNIPQADGSVNEDYISRANRFYGYAGLQYDHDANWWSRAQVRWHDAYDNIATDPSDPDSSDIRLTVAGAADGSMPGYGIFDIAAGWQSDDRRRAVTFIIENVFNRTYREPGSGTDGAGRNLVLSSAVRF